MGLAQIGFNGEIQLVNQELCTILGYSISEMNSINYFSLFPIASTIASEIFQTRSKDKMAGEFSFIKKDGSEVWVSITLKIVTDQNGIFLYSSLAHKDITLRKEIELSLSASEKNFRIMTEAIPQIVWTANQKGEINYFNNQWYLYSGLSKSESLNSGWKSIVHPNDIADIFSEWINSNSGNEIYKAERRFRRASDGQYRWHLGRAIPIRNSLGEIIKWFGTCTDVHDQREGEIEKNKAILSEKIALENSRVKMEFLSTISHEIRTPLNCVIGLSEILLDSPLDSDQYEYADSIKNSAEVLLDLINDVLDLSKIDASKLILENIGFDLKDMVRSLENQFQWSANQKGFPLLVNFDPSLPRWVKGDPTRIRQILTNLLSNVIKFTSDGQILWHCSINSSKFAEF